MNTNRNSLFSFTLAIFVGVAMFPCEWIQAKELSPRQKGKSAASSDSQCVDKVPIRFRFKGSWAFKSANLCFLQGGNTLLSKSCLAEKSSCEAKSVFYFPEGLKWGDMSNPTHVLCHKSGGIPKLSEVKLGKTWRPYSLCEFKDGSLIDLSTLWTRYQVYARP